MHILRPFLISLLSVLCVAAVGFSVYIGTLQLTILDRSVVKGWIQDGGVYQNKLFPTLIYGGSGTSQTVPNQYGIPVESAKLALERTFTKDYVQTQTETTIDRFYDWLEGKAGEFAVSIPIDKKRDTFINEFAHAATPHVAALPVCSSALTSNAPCRPGKINPDLYALTLATSIVNQSKFFDKPITVREVPANSSPMLQSLSILQSFVPYSAIALVSLLVLAVVSAIAHIWLIPATRRLRALAHLGRRVFFSQLFTFAAALFLLWAFYSGFFKLPGLSADQPTVIRDTINTVVQLAAMDFAGKLALLSGIICAVGLAMWVGITIYRQRKTHINIISELTDSFEPETTDNKSEKTS